MESPVNYFNIGDWVESEDDDNDIDLFGSDGEEESEEKKRITEERLKAYHEKKANKPKVIAKTSVLLDVKPWDDETPDDKMLECCKCRNFYKTR